MTGRVWCRVLTLCLVLGSTAQGAEISDHQPHFLKNEWYSEGWDQVVHFPDGTLLIAQISVVNVGFGSRHAAVFSALITPEGEINILKNSRSKGDWEYSEKRLELGIAEHSLSGEHPNYRFIMNKSNGQLDLELAAQTAPWRLAKVIEKDGEFHYASFFAPQMKAKGRYRFAEPRDLESTHWQSLENGEGFGVRFVYSSAVDELVRDTMRIAPVSSESIVPIFYLVTDAEGVSRNYMALFKDGKQLYEVSGFDLDVRFDFESGDPKGRRIPQSYSLDIHNDEFNLRGTIRLSRLLNRTDPIDSLKPFVRAVVRLLNTPIQFRYLAEYELNFQSQGENHALKGSALADYMVMKRAVVVATPRQR